MEYLTTRDDGEENDITSQPSTTITMAMTYSKRSTTICTAQMLIIRTVLTMK